MALKMQVKPEVEVSPVIEPVVLPHKVSVDAELSEVQALTDEYIELYKNLIISKSRHWSNGWTRFASSW